MESKGQVEAGSGSSGPAESQFDHDRLIVKNLYLFITSTSRPTTSNGPL